MKRKQIETSLVCRMLSRTGLENAYDQLRQNFEKLRAENEANNKSLKSALKRVDTLSSLLSPAKECVDELQKLWHAAGNKPPNGYGTRLLSAINKAKRISEKD